MGRTIGALVVAFAFASIRAEASAQDAPPPAKPPAPPAGAATDQPTTSTTEPAVAPVTTPKLPALPKLEWTVGDYKVKIGGYVKLDLLHDFNQIGSTDSFDPRTIPTSFDPSVPDQNTQMQAKQTRLNLDISSSGPLHIFVEGDFFGTSGAFRLRHAYGEMKVADEDKLLAGQTWTTFMDTDGMPETLDFESPTAFPQIRLAQARYTHDLGNGSYFAFAIEDPANDVVLPTGVSGSVGNLTPDLDAALNWNRERAHVRLGLWGGAVRFNETNGTTQDQPLWGLNLSSKVMTTGKDNAIAQLTYGDGIGRFRGGDVAAINASNNLVPLDVIALMGSYQHHWSDEYRSNIVYSWGAVTNTPSGLPPDTTKRTEYLAINFIWQFDPRAWTGIEYLYGSRDSVSHDRGADNRLQLSIRFDI
jgi:hypothetical protein